MTDPADRTGAAEDGPLGQPPAMPRWVKVSAIVVVVLLVVFLLLKLTGLGGQHGPGMHQAGGAAGDAGQAAAAQPFDAPA